MGVANFLYLVEFSCPFCVNFLSDLGKLVPTVGTGVGTCFRRSEGVGTVGTVPPGVRGSNTRMG